MLNRQVSLSPPGSWSRSESSPLVLQVPRTRPHAHTPARTSSPYVPRNSSRSPANSPTAASPIHRRASFTRPLPTFFCLMPPRASDSRSQRIHSFTADPQTWTVEHPGEPERAGRDARQSCERELTRRLAWSRRAPAHSPPTLYLFPRLSRHHRLRGHKPVPHPHISKRRYHAPLLFLPTERSRQIPTATAQAQRLESRKLSLSAPRPALLSSLHQGQARGPAGRRRSRRYAPQT